MVIHVVVRRFPSAQSRENRFSMSVWEKKLSDLEQFYPDRMASRILGMGDVMTLIEKAEAQIDEEKAAETRKEIQK